MTRKWRTKMRMKTLWSIQEIKLKNLSGLFSLVAQYFDVSADVDVDVDDAEAGVADVEAVDGVNAGNVKSRLSVMYLPIYPSIHLYLSVGLFLCLSIHLYIVSSVIWTEECISFLTSPQFSFYCLKEDVSFFFLLLFFYSCLTVQNENRSLNISFITELQRHVRNRFIITLISQKSVTKYRHF